MKVGVRVAVGIVGVAVEVSVFVDVAALVEVGVIVLVDGRVWVNVGVTF